MIETSLEKIKKIAKRREFTSFWEAVQYMLDAGYTELEALKIGLELFDGNVWDNVINASWRNPTSSVNNYLTGYTATVTSSGATANYFLGVDPAINEDDDLMVEVFSMTKESNPIYLPIYRSYIETRNYDEIKELESHIKSTRFKLTSELAINLFKDGCKKINKY